MNMRSQYKILEAYNNVLQALATLKAKSDSTPK